MTIKNHSLLYLYECVCACAQMCALIQRVVEHYLKHTSASTVHQTQRARAGIANDDHRFNRPISSVTETLGARGLKQLPPAIAISRSTPAVLPGDRTPRPQERAASATSEYGGLVSRHCLG